MRKNSQLVEENDSISEKIDSSFITGEISLNLSFTNGNSVNRTSDYPIKSYINSINLSEYGYNLNEYCSFTKVIILLGKLNKHVRNKHI